MDNTKIINQICKDIWIEILSHIISKTEHVICLMLTCKKLYDIIFTLKFYFYTDLSFGNCTTLNKSVAFERNEYIEYFMPNYPDEQKGKIYFYKFEYHALRATDIAILINKYNIKITHNALLGNNIVCLNVIHTVNNTSNCKKGVLIGGYFLSNKNLNIFTIEKYCNCLGGYRVNTNKKCVLNKNAHTFNTEFYDDCFKLIRPKHDF